MKYLVDKYGEDLAGFYKTNESKLLQKHIKNYFDKNSEVLLDTGLSYRLIFSDILDKPAIEKYTGITNDDMKYSLRTSGLIQPSWKKWNQQQWAFTLALTIRSYEMDNKKQETLQTLMFLTCGLYSSIHSKYFGFLPNANIMAYTLSNLNRKFYIKKFGTLFRALQETAITSHNTYIKSIIAGEDEDILEYVSQLASRINAFVKAFFSEYEKNRISKKYINASKEGRSEEDYREVDNGSFQISQLSQSMSINILSNAIRPRELRIAAKSSDVSVKVLGQAIANITESSKSKEVEEFITLILQIFIIDNNNSTEEIAGRKFLIETLSVYSKSNVNNPRILRIKALLDEWLEECSPNYARTERLATKSAFRKALFKYFVFSMQSIYTHK